VHVGADAMQLALHARGPDGLCLVSDALRGAGTGCEVFHWHGREHRIRGGAAYHEHAGDRTGRPATLAGSALSQLEMVQRLVRDGVLSAENALTMASETPSRALGDPKLGRLAKGAHADLIVLEPETLALREVWVGGERVR
jgi:N-acetylglucosamine-6-phosphate deacetylase